MNLLNIIRLISFLFILVTFQINAQTTKKLSIDSNIGVRFGGAVSDCTINNNKAKVLPGIHINGGVCYQLNKLISLRGGLSYDEFKTTLVQSIDRSELISGNLELIVNLKSFQYSDFGLDLHGGFGLSTLSNSKFNEVSESSGLGFNRNDNIMNIVLGLTPQIKLNYKISIIIDFACKLLVPQNMYVNPNQDGTVIDGTVIDKIGSIINFTIGTKYRF